MSESTAMERVSCTRLDGPCCDSCHDDAERGYDSLAVDELDYATGKYRIVAYTCCLKREAVDAALALRSHDPAPTSEETP